MLPVKLTLKFKLLQHSDFNR